jgi:rod shape-determining protein MreD
LSTSGITFRRRGPTTLHWSIPLMLAAAIAQSTLFRHLHLYGAAPNLVLAISVAWTLLRGAREGLLWAFVGGLALDLLSGGPLGLSSLALVLACAPALLTEGHVNSRALVFAMGAAACATLLFNGIMLLGLALGGQTLDPFAELAQRTLAATLLNTLSIVPIHLLLIVAYRSVERPEVGG